MKAKTKRLIGYSMFGSFIVACVATMSARMIIDDGWGIMATVWGTILGIGGILFAFVRVALWLIESKD